MRKIIVEESEIKKTLEEITRRQAKRNLFTNVTVKPYKGQKHPNEKEALYTITIS